MAGVGFIGLGTMGRPFATNIAHAGFDLMVYDLRPEPGSLSPWNGFAVFCLYAVAGLVAAALVLRRRDA